MCEGLRRLRQGVIAKDRGPPSAIRDLGDHMKNTKHNDVVTGTVFECQHADAGTVFLAGTFNDWNPETTPMVRADDGAWRIALELAPGRYEYKFVIDGKWCCEAGRDDWAGCSNCVRNDLGIECATCTPNAFGTMNRVREVTSPERIASSSHAA
jgi:hypothetical protein